MKGRHIRKDDGIPALMDDEMSPARIWEPGPPRCRNGSVLTQHVRRRGESNTKGTALGQSSACQFPQFESIILKSALRDGYREGSREERRAWTLGRFSFLLLVVGWASWTLCFGEVRMYGLARREGFSFFLPAYVAGPVRMARSVWGGGVRI